MSRYGCSADNNFCCGVVEIGCFAEDPSPWECEYFEDTFAELLEEVSGDKASGIVFHIWFVRPKDYNGDLMPDYNWQELRQIVQDIPDVLHLGTTINPNTGNEIDGYSWINK